MDTSNKINRRIASFKKVSYEQFRNDCLKNGHNLAESELQDEYYNLSLPKRATIGSAGYDFYSPFTILLNAGATVTIPTGIRCRMNNTFVLMMFPRSGLGFKFKARLDNTVAIIDSDYYYSDNEGHILIKISNEGDKVLEIEQGKAFCQGIFLPYGITEDDETEIVRNGGIGSTDSTDGKGDPSDLVSRL